MEKIIVTIEIINPSETPAKELISELENNIRYQFSDITGFEINELEITVD